MSIARNYGGLGLGLSIVHDLVRAHNGSLTVQSTVNVGSTFTFTLPAAEKPGTVPNGSGSKKGGDKRQVTKQPNKSGGSQVSKSDCVTVLSHALVLLCVDMTVPCPAIGAGSFLPCVHASRPATRNGPR
jgi:hypothetical protein